MANKTLKGELPKIKDSVEFFFDFARFGFRAEDVFFEVTMLLQYFIIHLEMDQYLLEY